MATDTVRDALNRLRDWGETIRHYNTRTVVDGQWVGHEEFFADLAILEAALAPAPEKES